MYFGQPTFILGTEIHTTRVPGLILIYQKKFYCLSFNETLLLIQSFQGRSRLELSRCTMKVPKCPTINKSLKYKFNVISLRSHIKYMTEGRGRPLAILRPPRPLAILGPQRPLTPLFIGPSYLVSSLKHIAQARTLAVHTTQV